MRALAILAVSVLSLTAAMQAHTAFSKVPVLSAPLSDNLPSLAPIIKKVGASIVSIAIRAPVAQRDSMFEEPVLRQFFGLPDLPQDMQSFAAGSGVVINSRFGLIVTNSHVVENAEQITVTLLDGREVQGILQGSDPDTDIAIIKVPLNNLPPATFANSDKLGVLRVGDAVEMAALRNDKAVRIQATLTEPPIKLLEGDRLTPLFEGAVFTNGASSTGKKGVQVATINSASKAWSAGLREGDLINSVNQKNVTGLDEFETEVTKTPNRLVLDLVRDGESFMISVKTNGGAFPNALR
jgi:S1-C subfamily serine protease